MRRLSEVEKSEIWDRFEAGESQQSISRRLGRSPSSIRSYMVSSGFRRPAPSREWSSLRLSLTEREEISRGLAAGDSMRTLVERWSRYVMLFGLPDGNTAEAVRAALTETVQRLPDHLWLSLTWDQGKEMAQHVSCRHHVLRCDCGPVRR